MEGAAREVLPHWRRSRRRVGWSPAGEPNGHRSVEGHCRRSSRIYGYDALYRLTSESITLNSQPSTINYSYDPVGNRLSRQSTLNPILSTSAS